MKIKRIVLYNIGPYIDKNEFDITIDNKKNIVLIGGKNGAGKTTFFQSIKTCLYGSRVLGYDVPCASYFNTIKQLVNIKLQYDNNFKAYIELEIQFNDGKEDNRYILHREWHKEKKQIVETYNIFKNGILLENEKYNDFTNYLLSIIPPDMFNFYFFDGESIADYFLGSDGNKNFKNAFLKLYGLDTLSLMIDNFARCTRRKNHAENKQDKYFECKNKKELNEMKIEETNALVSEILNQIDQLNSKIEILNVDYEREGGITLEKWKNLNSEIAKEETEREEINKWFKEIANNYLPFLLVKEQLELLKNEIYKEAKTEKVLNVYEYFNNNINIDQLNKFAKNQGIDLIIINQIVSYIKNKTDVDNNLLLNLSSVEASKLLNQIEEKEKFDKEEIYVKQKALKNSLKKSKKYKNLLAKSNIDGYENLIKNINNIKLQIRSKELLLETTKSDLIKLQEDQIVLNKNFDKAKQEFEMIIKSKAINEMSTRAVAVYTLLEEKLIRQQSEKLQNEFIKCFKAIINKDNFIDGIFIDKKINVIPYKLINISKTQINNYLDEIKLNNFIDLLDVKYKREIDKLLIDEVDTITIPSPIKSPFSQGERQVYIMSLYLALLKTSGKDIPFFIDTPFARIDSSHREKIIKEFFLGLNNQMFILSTDEEIVGNNKKILKNNISNEYILEINNYGVTKVIKDCYFKEVEE